MPSVKDTNYKLPVIEPLQKHKVFTNSTNKPLLITGVDSETGLKGDYVVKLMKAERMSESAVMRNLWRPMEMDLPVTLPV